jgi:preprotein translocase subunit SecG
MGLIGIIILVILIISAVLLVLVVLIQDEEGEGIGGIFSGGSTTPFGSRAGNVLTRFTAILAAIFFVCAFFLAFINRTPDSGNVIGKARQESITSQDKNWWTPLTGQTATTPESGPQSSTTAPSSGATTAPATTTQAGGQ